MLEAGVAMLLPRVANPFTVTESDVNVSTLDGTADCYFVRPASGVARGVVHLTGDLWSETGILADGQTTSRIGYSVLLANPTGKLMESIKIRRAKRSRLESPFDYNDDGWIDILLVNTGESAFSIPPTSNGTSLRSLNRLGRVQHVARHYILKSLQRSRWPADFNEPGCYIRP
jgi:hypothetical protein